MSLYFLSIWLNKLIYVTWSLTQVLLLMIWFVSFGSKYKDLEEVCCQAETLTTVFFEE